MPVKRFYRAGWDRSAEDDADIWPACPLGLFRGRPKTPARSECVPAAPSASRRSTPSVKLQFSWPARADGTILPRTKPRTPLPVLFNLHFPPPTPTRRAQKHPIFVTRQPPANAYSTSIRGPEAHRVRNQFVEGHAKIKDGISVEHNLLADNMKRVESLERLKLMRDEICKADTGPVDL